MSAPHPEYEEDETQEKLQRALEYSPWTCATIESKLNWEGCLKCPYRDTIRSPIVLGAKRSIKLMTEAEALPIVEAAMAALKAAKPDAKPLFQQRTFEALAALNDDARNAFFIQLRELLRDNPKLKAVVSLRDLNAGLKKAQKQRTYSEAKKKREAKASPGLFTIEVFGRHLRDVSDDALKSLVKANDPPEVFVHGSDLAFVHCEKDDEGEKLSISRFTPPRMKRRLSRVANFDSEEPRNGMLAPPDAVIRDILHSQDWQGLPQLNGVITVPILRSDGTFHSEPGFDAVTGLYYRPPTGFVLPEIPENPTDDDLKASVRIIFEPFKDFPFTGPTDWAHELALMLTLLVRPIIKGNLPGFAVSANRPGVGKTLQGELPCIIVLGLETGEPLPPTSDDEEWRKKITTELKMGTPLALIDNVMGRLNSPALAAVVTCRRWKDRILGVTDAPRLPNNTIWVVTGNNLRFGDDLIRRFIRIFMFWADENPESNRKFDHKNIKEWTKLNRPQLLAALFTIVRAWFARGRPEAPDQKLLGSFEEWSRVIGGMLYVAKVPGFLGNLEEGQNLNDGDSAHWARFFRAFFSVCLDEPVTVAALVQLTEKSYHTGIDPLGRVLLDALPDYVIRQVNRNGTGLGCVLGNAFKSIAGTIYGGFVLENAGENKATHTSLWRVTGRDQNKLPEHARYAHRILGWLRDSGWFTTKGADPKFIIVARLAAWMHSGSQVPTTGESPAFPDVVAETNKAAVLFWLKDALPDETIRAAACAHIIAHFSIGMPA